MTHVVTAPLIAVRASGEWRQLLAGATVPSGVKSDDITRLEREGYIQKVAESPADETSKEPAKSKDAAKIPTKSGPGSGDAAWRTYAESVGVSVDGSVGRDDIIKAVAAAGQPTE